MTSFFCTLWGDKYSKEYVQKLRTSLNMFYSGEFTLYCQTDQKLDIPGVVELPFLDIKPDDSPRCKVKPKMNFWKPNGWGISGRKVFLDLDIAIVKNIDTMVDLLYRGRPIISRAWWQDELGINQEPNNYLAYRGIVNSSVIIWEDSALTESIWNHIEDNMRYVFFCGINGQDGYLSSTHLDKFDFIPHNMVKSYHNEKLTGDERIILFDTKINHITYGTQKEMHELKGEIKDILV